MAQLSQTKFKQFRALTLKKYRQLQGKFLIEGITLCQEAFDAHVDIQTLLYDPEIVSSDTANNFVSLCEARSIPYYEISHDMLLELSDTVNSQGIICIVNIIQPKLDFDHVKFILAIDAASDPGNLGTIIRTADWFGVDVILLGKGSVELYNPKVLRSTMGSIYRLPIVDNIDLPEQLKQLKKRGFFIYAADVRGTKNYDEIEFDEHKTLVVGNEINGISSEILSLCDVKLRIPSRGKAESLNVAIATGIILSQMVKYDR